MWLLYLYLAVLQESPLPVKAVTSACLAASSDAIAQRLLGASRLSARRSMLMALFGLVWYGPSNHLWQSLLVALFPPPAHGGLAASTLQLLKRVGLDQLVYAPCNNALMILYVALAADQRSWAAASSKVAAELPTVQRRGWRLWPAVQLMNQSLVPLELRVLVNNLVAVAWTCFVILRARSAQSARKLPVFSSGLGQAADQQEKRHSL